MLYLCISTDVFAIMDIQTQRHEIVLVLGLSVALSSSDVVTRVRDSCLLSNVMSVQGTQKLDLSQKKSLIQVSTNEP